MIYYCYCIHSPIQISYSIDEYIKNKGMPQVENGQLDFSGLGLTSLQGLKQIRGASDVTYLDFSDNKITQVPAGIFSTFPNLEELILNNNQINQLDDKSFTGLSKLFVLDLSKNQLTELPTDVFTPLVGLTQLDISNNKLKRLSPSQFKSLQYVSSLNLDYNELDDQLPKNLFNPLSNLRVLNIFSNPITNKLTKEQFQEQYLPGKHAVNLFYKHQFGMRKP